MKFLLTISENLLNRGPSAYSFLVKEVDDSRSTLPLLQMGQVFNNRRFLEGVFLSMKDVIEAVVKFCGPCSVHEVQDYYTGEPTGVYRIRDSKARPYSGERLLAYCQVSDHGKSLWTSNEI